MINNKVRIYIIFILFGAFGYELLNTYYYVVGDCWFEIWWFVV